VIGIEDLPPIVSDASPPDAKLPDAKLPDAKLPDASPPDATPCRGHACPEIDSPFQLPEHGEFRLEQFQYGPSGTGAEDDLAAHAFFFTGQTPPTRSLEGTEIPIRQALRSQGYVCQDLSAGNNFDNGKSVQAQLVANSRDYIDLGANVQLTNANDDSHIINFNKSLRANDPDAATDLSALLQHEILYGGAESKDAFLSHGDIYKPEIAGSFAYPRLTLGSSSGSVSRSSATRWPT
jgi:hypothetical protein